MTAASELEVGQKIVKGFQFMINFDASDSLLSGLLSTWSHTIHFGNIEIVTLYAARTSPQCCGCNHWTLSRK